MSKRTNTTATVASTDAVTVTKDIPAAAASMCAEVLIYTALAIFAVGAFGLVVGYLTRGYGN